MPYPARLVGVVDLGVHQTEWQGEKKDPRSFIHLTYECLDEFMHDEDGEPIPEKPRWFSEDMPHHNLRADKAKSTKRYFALDPNAEHEGDWTALLGTPVMINLVTNKGTGKHAGKTFTNISGVSVMRAKDVSNAPALVNTPFSFDMSDPDMDVWEQRIPEFIKDKIKSSLEFEGSALDMKLNEGETKVSTNTDGKEDWE